MTPLVRGMIVPFFAFLFPMVWYANRNLTTDVLPPRLEPSTDLILVALGAAAATALVLAAVLSVLHRRLLANGSNRLRRWVFEPDDRTLAVFLCQIVILAVWALPALVGVGPDALELALTPLVGLFGLPLLLVVPFALEASPLAHTLVVVALPASAVWMVILAAITADRLERALT